jgi:hypothetical protein
MTPLYLLPLLLLTACPGPAPPKPTPLPNAMPYLIEGPQQAGRHDWPLPLGYVALTNAQESATTARQSWKFTPFDSPAPGDGFQTAEVGSDGWVRFTSTKDGGTPYVQFFVGQNCGGSGWLVFNVNAQSGSWRDAVARLSISPDPAACPPLGQAYTRYRRETVDFPFAMAGTLSTRSLAVMISEHYDFPSIAESQALERSYLAQGYGLVRWEAWGRAPPSIPDLPERCSPVAFSDPPQAGWFLRDCRTYTNIP